METREEREAGDRDWPVNYLGYFDCFNRGRYFEAHEVLEELWLPLRKGPEDRFYRGLIQLAGAFVHFGKGRMRPARSLLELARGHLSVYPEAHQGIRTDSVLSLIDRWLLRLDREGGNPFLIHDPPRLDGPGQPGGLSS